MVAYYNEIDPFAAQWLRNLIDAGHIAPGVVDTRSIEDVTPNDLIGFNQCHFFAGIGGWSLALRRAGWPDSRPAWTASCPCQPFSAAGKGLGFADERHLWPSAHWLIGQRRPVVVFGEQSGSADADDWIDLVQADLEGVGYAFGALAFPSASVGAPHWRDRAYWVADADRHGREGRLSGGQDSKRKTVNGSAGCDSTTCGLAYADNEQRPFTVSAGSYEDISRQWNKNSEEVAGCGGAVQPGPVNGFWRDADWLCGRDGKWRPVRPGSFPLANGVPGRVGRLRAYGNAINIEAATAFIKAYMAAEQ
ncbi:TPA: DNA cytosine methyltransferase [Klebsiella pneumoniae]|uniref:DNA cytosine methyltransferase n=1 Tax=Klebsiella pneumoniae TaxID=573 RepID=UPI000E2DA44E|nr:DNA cytosine methyltransferase [Klebsiella pneumoniae]MBD7102935.1 DNA cytosine methyltransferase [Klebsiella pneumoniae]MBD7108509.1 DNA cytosine methyltransferase [Klebsiella pneumoniae]MBG2367527.1 DNA cytosine methyltransferase [Klebsiella pneumoniae]MBG2443630.1 DNA cytosine methyltransferase [Klebsiella pneumoniae]SVL59198.1 C-5 cytosine-specific DNA methylase [Klebsiella pneumoniae]